MGSLIARNYNYYKSATKCNNNHPNNNSVEEQPSKDQKPRQQKSIHYQLFMYNEELRRRNTRQLRITASKIQLTDTIITHKVQHLQDATNEDLFAISREMSFKKHLQKQVSRYGRLAALGINVNCLKLQSMDDMMTSTL